MRLAWTVVLCLLCATVAHAAQIDESVYRQFQNSSSVSVIVELKEVAPLPVLTKASEERRQEQFEARKARIRHSQESTLRRLGLNPAIDNANAVDDVITRRYSSVNAFAGSITLKTLKRLSQDKDVERVYLNQILHLNLNDTRIQVRASEAQELTLNSVPITGKGETVCVLDTGIDYNHENLGSGWGRVVLDGYDYVNDDNDPFDDHGHGTHVAGIIASNHSVYRGIAPGAKLVALKVCNDQGSCAGDDMIAGVDWCVNNASKYNISVITMSIGDSGEYDSSTCPDWMDSSINAARSRGIVVTVSSGNDYHKQGIAYPSCTENATAVGSVDKRSQVTGYSDSSELLDLLAPGGTSSAKVVSTKANGGFVGKYGTSMAAPHVAGAVALLQEFSKLQDNQSLSPEAVLSLLRSTGTNVTDSGNNLTFPIVNAHKAIVAADHAPPTIAVTTPDGLRTSLETYTITAQSNEALSIALLQWNGANISMQGSRQDWNYTAQGNGLYQYMVYGNDSAGHWAASSLKSILLNDSAPIITSHYPGTSLVNIREPENQSFNISWLEPNGQNVTVRWYVNKTLAGSLVHYLFLGNYSSAGSYNITVKVNDSSLAASYSWIVVVNNTNRPPLVQGAFITPVWPGAHSSLVCNNQSATDPDNDSVTFYYDWYSDDWKHINSMTLGPGNLTPESTWNCSIVPFDGQNNGTRVVSPMVTVNNQAPNITATLPHEGRVSISEPDNQSFSITVIDESALAITWLRNNTNLTAEYNQTSYTFYGDYASAGSYAITAIASDGVLSANKTWILMVNNTNRNPLNVLPIPNQKSYRNRNVSINLSLYFSDPDNDNLTFGYSSFANASILVFQKIAKIVPSANYSGKFELSINCSDGQLVSTGNRFNVTFTIDFDSDGHAAIAYQGDDCSDNNPTIYPGAGCTRSCYIGSSYDANCICSGGTYDCGGNAGGGGATATQEKAAESHYFDSIQAGAATQLAVRNENLAVTRTLFRTNATRSAVTISIRKANDAGQVLRNAYQYLEITHSNLADSEIASAEIEFRVDLKWLNGYDEGSVSLNRYFGSRWERLPTSKTGNTSAFVYYRAHSTGLSLFAITAEKKQSLLLESKPVMQENASNATIRNGTIHIESPAAPPASIERTQLEKPSIMNEAPSAVNSQSRAWLQEGIFLLISLVVLALFAIVTFLYRSIAMAAQRTERLERYVEKRLMLGHKEQDIKGSLAELGWPEKAVHHHVRRAKEKHIADRTEHRIAERLSLGEDEQEIRRSLIGQDSSPRRIQKHIRRAKRLINE